MKKKPTETQPESKSKQTPAERKERTPASIQPPEWRVRDQVYPVVSTVAPSMPIAPVPTAGVFTQAPSGGLPLAAHSASNRVESETHSALDSVTSRMISETNAHGLFRQAHDQYALHDNYYPHLYHDDWYQSPTWDHANDQYDQQSYLHDEYYPHLYYRDWYDQDQPPPENPAFQTFAPAAGIAAGLMWAGNTYGDRPSLGNDASTDTPSSASENVSFDPFSDQTERHFPLSENRIDDHSGTITEAGAVLAPSATSEIVWGSGQAEPIGTTFMPLHEAPLQTDSALPSTVSHTNQAVVESALLTSHVGVPAEQVFDGTIGIIASSEPPVFLPASFSPSYPAFFEDQIGHQTDTPIVPTSMPSTAYSELTTESYVDSFVAPTTSSIPISSDVSSHPILTNALDDGANPVDVNATAVSVAPPLAQELFSDSGSYAQTIAQTPSSNLENIRESGTHGTLSHNENTFYSASSVPLSVNQPETTVVPDNASVYLSGSTEAVVPMAVSEPDRVWERGTTADALLQPTPAPVANANQVPSPSAVTSPSRPVADRFQALYGYENSQYAHLSAERQTPVAEAATTSVVTHETSTPSAIREPNRMGIPDETAPETFIENQTSAGSLLQSSVGDSNVSSVLASSQETVFSPPLANPLVVEGSRSTDSSNAPDTSSLTKDSSSELTPRITTPARHDQIEDSNASWQTTAPPTDVATDHFAALYGYECGWYDSSPSPMPVTDADTTTHGYVEKESATEMTDSKGQSHQYAESTILPTTSAQFETSDARLLDTEQGQAQRATATEAIATSAVLPDSSESNARDDAGSTMPTVLSPVAEIKKASGQPFYEETIPENKTANSDLLANYAVASPSDDFANTSTPFVVEPAQASDALLTDSGQAFLQNTPETDGSLAASFVSRDSMSDLLFGNRAKDTCTLETEALLQQEKGSVHPAEDFLTPEAASSRDSSLIPDVVEQVKADPAQFVWDQASIDEATVLSSEMNTAKMLIQENPSELPAGEGSAVACLAKDKSNTIPIAAEHGLYQAQDHGLESLSKEEERNVFAFPKTTSDTTTNKTVNKEASARSAESFLIEPVDKRAQAERFLIPCESDSVAEKLYGNKLLIEHRAEMFLHEHEERFTEDLPAISGIKPRNVIVRGAKSAGLGLLGAAGRLTQRAGKTAGSAVVSGALQALKQDEDMTVVANVLEDGIKATAKTQVKSQKSSVLSSLQSNRKTEQLLISSDNPLHEKTAGSWGDMFLTSDSKQEANDFLLKGNHEQSGNQKRKDKKEDEGNSQDKKPVTKREREREAKEAKRKLSKKDKNESSKLSALLPASDSKETTAGLSDKGTSLKGIASFAGSMASSTAKRALTSENEEIAATLSMVSSAKRATKAAVRVARIPQKAFYAVRGAYRIAKTTVIAVWNTVQAAVAAGWPIILLAVLFILIVGLLLVLLGSASIINDEQEVSEVAALVAELDEELTEEIQELGSAPILYADARQTYQFKGDDESLLTLDLDLSDNESELQEVVASSVTVQTNPDEIIAYIDAKYEGKWQVGAASWKYTVDAFGKTWSIFDWDNVPEWVQEGLNKIGKADFKLTLQMELEQYLGSTIEGIDPDAVQTVAGEIAEELAVVIYDEQITGLSEDIVLQIIKDAVKRNQEDLDISDDVTRNVYYEMLESITGIVGEEEPVALVYDEIIALYDEMNFWSEDYEHIETSVGGGAGTSLPDGTGSGTDNAYGYPNASGYDEAELANWDGYNEVSVYGISEAGTTSITGDGTRITNDWNDTNMAIACEGLQNDLFAYWTRDYKDSTGISDPAPVRITMYNPNSGSTVTAEVRDCGGWRGFNERYTGLNLERQWDLLPAVWLALGGTPTSGLMNVYWKVEEGSGVGSGAAGSVAAEPIAIEGYPWLEETDEKDGMIHLNRPTFIAHSVQDVLNNDPLFTELLNAEAYASEQEFKRVKNFVSAKVKDVMFEFLSFTNSNGETFTDYLYLRRNLANPFGKNSEGRFYEWTVSHRFNPGYEDFNIDEAYVELDAFGEPSSIYAMKKGVVDEVKDGSVSISIEIDTGSREKMVYSNLIDIQVEEGDEVKRGTLLGSLDGETLRLSWYEVDVVYGLMEFKNDWAYAPSLFVVGFAGYESADEPEEYVGGGSPRSYEDCETIVEFAQSRLGCPYVWAATGPDAFDCSGLTQWCYAQAGISIPRSSEEQHNAAVAAGNCFLIDESKMQPGDILWRPGHVGIYIGNNQYIHAPEPGDVVKVSTGLTSLFTHALRFT